MRWWPTSAKPIWCCSLEADSRSFPANITRCSRFRVRIRHSFMCTRERRKSAACTGPILRSSCRRATFCVRRARCRRPRSAASDHLAVGRQLFESWNRLPAKVPGEFNLAEAIRSLREVVPEDTIVCNGAGNYSSWVHRFYRYERFGTQLAPTSGSMGYGIPAAVAAKRIYPEKTVIAFAGDGCFLMNGQEFATAVQYELPIVVMIADNGMYGTIRMHQEREYPGRVVATQLRNPDFVGYAQCFGGYGERVERTRDFAPALARAIASGKPAILHCMMDPQAITPGITLDEIRASQSSHCANY